MRENVDESRKNYCDYRFAGNRKDNNCVDCRKRIEHVLIVIYYLTGGNNSMSRFCKFGKLHVTKGNVDKLLGILLTASKELKRSLAPTGNLYR